MTSPPRSCSVKNEASIPTSFSKSLLICSYRGYRRPVWSFRQFRTKRFCCTWTSSVLSRFRNQTLGTGGLSSIFTSNLVASGSPNCSKLSSRGACSSISGSSSRNFCQSKPMYGAVNLGRASNCNERATSTTGGASKSGMSGLMLVASILTDSVPGSRSTVLLSTKVVTIIQW